MIFEGSKSKSITDGKIEIDCRILDTGKLQYSSHPEVAHWQDEILKRRRERKLREKEGYTPTENSLGNDEEGKDKDSTHPPTPTEEKSRVKCLPILAALVPHISKFVGG